MKNGSKSLSWIHWLLPVLITLAVVKLAWVVIEYLYLPTRGVEQIKSSAGKSLYQPYRLASNEALKPVKRPRPKPRRQNLIRDMKLLGVYQGPRHQIAVITKGNKSYVVYRGDEVLGYRIDAVEDHAVSLSRDGKKYRLELARSKSSTLRGTPSGAPRPSRPAAGKKKQEKTKILDEGDTKVIPKSLINDYAKDLDKIRKYIGLVPYKKGGALQGFKVRFVKRGSDFAKLGLKRGDIITGINGEPIVDYSTPMELMKNIDTLEGLTLQIKRGNEELEIEYEVR